jgi:4-azaleucine resistance transporter AzlC
MPGRPSYFRDGIVLGVAVGVFGAAFGVLAVASGLTVAQASAMSLLVFTGASQLAAVGIIGAGGSSVTALGSALLLAARNGVYGMVLASRLSVRGPKRIVGAQLVIDESTAMAVAQPDDASARGAFWVTGIAVFVCWNAATLLGAIAGNAIGDPKTFGLDAAFPAGFLALMAPMLRERPKRAAAIIGAAIAVVAIPTTRAGVPILLAAFAAPIVLLIERSAPTR